MLSVTTLAELIPMIVEIACRKLNVKSKVSLGTDSLKLLGVRITHLENYKDMKKLFKDELIYLIFWLALTGRETLPPELNNLVEAKKPGKPLDNTNKSSRKEWELYNVSVSLQGKVKDFVENLLAKAEVCDVLKSWFQDSEITKDTPFSTFKENLDEATKGDTSKKESPGKKPPVKNRGKKGDAAEESLSRNIETLFPGSGYRNSVFVTYNEHQENACGEFDNLAWENGKVHTIMECKNSAKLFTREDIEKKIIAILAVIGGIARLSSKDEEKPLPSGLCIGLETQLAYYFYEENSLDEIAANIAYKLTDGARSRSTISWDVKNKRFVKHLPKEQVEPEVQKCMDFLEKYSDLKIMYGETPVPETE